MDHVDLDDVRKDMAMWLELIDAASDAYEALPAAVREAIEAQPTDSQLATRMATLATASPAYRAMLSRTVRLMLDLSDTFSGSRPTLALVSDESPQ